MPYAILIPKLLVKAYNYFPYYLVFLAEIFISRFSKLRFMKLDSFTRNKINIKEFTIYYALSLKFDLECLKVIKDFNSIVLLGIISFYLSVSFKMIEKANQFFTDELMESNKRRITIALKFLKPGIFNQILQFQGKYYEY